MTEPSGFANPPSRRKSSTRAATIPARRILNNFANAVLGLEPLYVDGQEGIKCVELIDSMLLSAWKDKAVSLPVDDDEYYAELKKHIDSSREKAGEDILIDNSMSYGGTK